MATSELSKVIQKLRTTAIRREGVDLTDGQLLDCFVNRREIMALEDLVRRHSTMVWNVCRRILHNHHDAEDAFQATFLVLVRKAASIKPREMVGNWLYGVANQTALKARTTTAKRRMRERQQAEIPETSVPERERCVDLQPLLDQALSRLPDKYRVVVVLCELEGKTRSEAARQLGLPEGTIASRLARARTMLAKRLARYGLAISGGMFASVLSQNAAAVTLPTTALACTIKAVTSVAAGKAVVTTVSSKVAALAEGVIMTMWLTKLKAYVAAVLVLGLLAIGATALTWSRAAGQNDEPPITEKRLEAAPKQKTEKGQPIGENAIKAGDRLQIEVAGTPPERAIKGFFRVEPQGTVNLGVSYGRVKVSGQTFAEAEVTIRNHLKLTLKTPEVSVNGYDPLLEDKSSALAERVLRLENDVRALKTAVEQLRKQKGQ
jgi:RNA polymerase sigma factor (sigma-70 family)